MMLIQRIRMQGGGPFGRAAAARFSSRNPFMVAAAFVLIPLLLALLLALLLGAIVLSPLVALAVLGARKLGLLGGRKAELNGTAHERAERLDRTERAGPGDAIDVVAEVQRSESLPPS